METKVMHVLYLSYTGMTDPLGQSQVLAYLEKLSQTEGYRFTIISFEKKGAYEQGRTTVEAVCRRAGMTWYPLSYTAKPPVLSTFRDVRRMKQLAFRLAEKHSFSLVHCRSYIPSLVGLSLKRKKKIPFLFDMRGFWADERIDGGLWKLSNPLYRLIYAYFKKQEKQFLQQADQIVSLTHNAKQEIHQWNLNPVPAPITVIPCCADFSHFNPFTITAEQKNAVLASLDIPSGSPVFSYLGTLGTWYMLDEMMAFACSFQKENPQAYFMVLTGEPEDLVRKAAKNAGFDDRFLRVKKVPRSEVPLYLSVSSFSIFFIKPAFSKKASSPVKQGELMAMGIPVVCNDKVGDTADIIKECNAGVVLSDFNETAYKMAAQELLHRRFDPHQIRTAAERYFLLSNGAAAYAGVYKKLSEPKI